MNTRVKEICLKAVSNIALKTAIKAAGAASWWDSYQPKEPKELKTTFARVKESN